MPLRIDDPGRLDTDQRMVFDGLVARVTNPHADRDYDRLQGTGGGRVISVDLARFLAPEFRTWSGRLRHTLSTASPAGAYAHDRLSRSLRSHPGPRKRLIITAGGAGSGKTTQLSGHTSLADLVFDNQLRNHARAREVLVTARLHGWEVEVVYVHRPFHDVVRAVIDRSQRTGRWNSLKELPRTHADAQRTILRLWSEFRDGVHIDAIYNASKGQAEQAPGSRVLFRNLRLGGAYHLQENEATTQVIHRVLDQALSQGIVCRQLARLIAGGTGWRPKRPR